MSETEELAKDMSLSQRIENILRNVEGHVLLYLEHYKGLSENLSGSEREEDLVKIKNCIPSLEGAKELITDEIERFEKIKKSVIQKSTNKKNSTMIKTRLNVVQVHMNKILPPLNAYIEGLSFIVADSRDMAAAKRSIGQRAEMIQSAYNKFVANNEAYITDMRELIKELGIKD
jgi:hypothetical protein